MHWNLKFDGYWPKREMATEANWPGIYCVYAFVSDTSSYLLYIGEAQRVGTNILTHRGFKKWKRAANGYPLLFSSAMIVPEDHCHRVTAAMIHYHKPPCNEERYKEIFPFSRTSILTEGKTLNLEYYFTVYRKE